MWQMFLKKGIDNLGDSLGAIGGTAYQIGNPAVRYYGQASWKGNGLANTGLGEIKNPNYKNPYDLQEYIRGKGNQSTDLFNTSSKLGPVGSMVSSTLTPNYHNGIYSNEFGAPTINSPFSSINSYTGGYRSNLYDFDSNPIDTSYYINSGLQQFGGM